MLCAGLWLALWAGSRVPDVVDSGEGERPATEALRGCWGHSDYQHHWRRRWVDYGHHLGRG